MFYELVLKINKKMYQMSLSLHPDIESQLNNFIDIQKVPNIIFYGDHGNGKKTLLVNFLQKLYSYDKAQIKEHVMIVNCAHGKGIKFVREELKYFAKSNIHYKNGISFKSILLLNADTLTIDAQSALRRCIELFSNNTRFFIVVENLDSMLKPILSRFCQIFVPRPFKDSFCNVYESKNKVLDFGEFSAKKLKTWIKNTSSDDVCGLVNKIYNAGMTAKEIIEFIECNRESIKSPDQVEEILFAFSKLKKEFRNEKMLLYFVVSLFFSPFSL
jgi:DNA polymerase III delta prime subunit